MTKEIDIRMGEMAVGSGKTVIQTGGIGSCVVVVLYDDKAKVGGLAHAMLPARKGDSKVAHTTEMHGDAVAKYTDEAIERLINEVEKAGGNKNNMKARLIGGSHMFKTVSDSDGGIGRRNVKEARETLSGAGIPIHSEEIGGSVGRIARLDLYNGLVSVTTKM